MEKTRKTRFGIAQRLFLWFLLLSLVPIAIGGTVSFYITKQELEKTTKANLSDLARDCGRKISYYVSSRFQDIKLLSQAEVFRGDDTDAKQRYIEKAVGAYPFYAAISVIDLKGTIIACTRSDLVGQSRATAAWFQKTMQAGEGEVIALDAYRAETAGEKIVIGFNTPIVDRDGRAAGVLTTRVNADHILDRVRTLDERIPGDYPAYLLNGQGEIIAGPDEGVFLTMHPLHGFSVVRDLLAGKTGITIYKSGTGEAVISARYALEGEGDFDGWRWGILLTEPVSEAFKGAYILRNTLIVVAVVIAIFVALFAVFISMRFSRPITELSEAAQRISKGDLKPVSIAYGSKDEMGELVSAFNRMTEDLHETTVSRDSLVKEIAERKRAEDSLRRSEEKMSNLLHASPIPTFVIDNGHRVTYWNAALEEYSGIKSEDIVGTDGHWRGFYPEKRPCMADLLVDERIDLIAQWYTDKYRPSDLIEGAYEATDYLPRGGRNGRWLYFIAAPLRDSAGKLIGAVETLQDITERKQAEEQIRMLTGQVIEIEERERESLSREIHDNIGQLLLALRMGLSRATKKIPTDLSEMKDRLAELTYLANRVIQEIRGFSHALHPPQIEDLGLVPALEGLCQDFRSYSEITIKCNFDDIEKPLSSMMNITIYRLFQEGLNNILKHSHASEANLTLTCKDSAIQATIKDNGIGFVVDDVLSASPNTKTLGLISMRERVSLIGGELRISSHPGSGTTISASFRRSDSYEG